jgi:SAM-dependent methyltransferase
MNSPETPFECGICGGTIAEFLFSARDFNFRTTDESFSIVRCPACGTAQTVPRPPEHTLGRFYPPLYYPISGHDPAYYRRMIRPSQLDKLDIVRRFKSSGTLLDVGCGAGYFVREAEDRGFSAQGIEFSREAVDFGRRQVGARITEGDFLETHLPDDSFDIVTLWHVLEHIPRPIETLKKIRTLLKPGGILIIAVPNLDSIQARVFRGHWYHLEVPRHLYHFTPAALRKLLESQGFDVLAEDQRSPEHNWAGIFGSIVRLVPADKTVAGRLRVARLIACRPLARAAAAVETAIHRGGTFTLISELKQ